MSRPQWQEFVRGDLVQVYDVHVADCDQNKEITFLPTGVILSYYDSNVYESSSCDVLVKGQVMHVPTRKLKMIKEKNCD